MAYAVELYFDEATESAIRGFWTRLDEAGISSLSSRVGCRPHLTLAAFLQVDQAGMRAEMKRYAGQLSRFEIQLPSLEANGTTYTITVAPSAELTAAHANLAKVLYKYIQSPRPEYAVGRWAPRCVLAEDLSSMQARQADEIICQIFTPMEATITEVGMAQVNPIRSNPIFVAEIEGSGFKDRYT